MRITKKQWLIFISIISIMILTCFAYYIFNDKPYMYGTDIKTQWYFFYTEFRNLISNFIRKGTLPFYSWSLFLGNNFYASKSYYVMGDLYNYFSMLLNGNFFNIAMIMTMIKIFVSSLTMFLYLKQLKLSFKSMLLGSILYGFSAWAIFYSGQLSFLSFYSFIPLYFMGMELYMVSKKRYVYIIATSILLFTNFYFFFTISIFSVFYYIYRYYTLEKQWNLFIKETLILIFYYLVGVTVTMVLTLPTIFYILSNDRVGNFVKGLRYDDINVYLHQLINILVPNYLYIYKVNAFEYDWHVIREMALWSGTIVSILLPQIFFNKNSKMRKANIAIYLLFIVIMTTPMLNSIMHGFSDPSFRWLVFVVFMNITLVCIVFDDLENINKKILKYTVIIEAILLIISIPISLLLQKKIESIMDFKPQIILFAICAINIVVFALIIFSKFNKKKIIIITLTVIEICAATLILFVIDQNFGSDDYGYLNSLNTVLQENRNDLSNYLDYIDTVGQDEYYRVFVDYDDLYWSFSHNMALMYQLNGTMTYDSTYSPSFNDLKNITDNIKVAESEWQFDIKDADVLTLLNVKYLLVIDESKLPENGNYQLIQDDYVGGVSIYLNLDYRKLGNSYDQIKVYDDTTTIDDLLNFLVVDQDDYLEIKSLNSENGDAKTNFVDYAGNALYASVYSTENDFVVMGIPYDGGWSVKVNGENVETYKVNGGLIGFKIFQGENDIEMIFTPQGFKVGFILSFIGILIILVMLIYDFIKKRGKNVKSN